MDDSSSQDDKATFDPARRKLCADGACVGVIGADGRCGECGRTEAEAAAGAEPADRGVDLATAASGEDAPIADATNTGGFDPKRHLCADGSCVGVVGADGKCRVCGRRSQ
jgi:hypothetical protein